MVQNGKEIEEKLCHLFIDDIQTSFFLIELHYKVSFTTFLT